MKIGIIGFCNLNIMQYLYKYTNVLDEQDVPYDVVYWDRLGIQETAHFQGNVLPYRVPLNTYQPFYSKILDFLKYAFFIRRTVRQNRYDKLIVLTTQTATVLSDLLCGKYKGRYIFDFRDITKEKKSRLYNRLVHRLFARSFCTMLSSEGFLKEIGPAPNARTQLVHNTQTARKSDWHADVNTAAMPVRVAFWGIVRQPAYNRKVCDCFGRDARFQVVFHGTGAYEDLRTYCAQNGYSNISFTGIYRQEDVAGFAADADVLHCLYANDEEQQPAMPVKAYDAIRYRLPVLVNRNSQAEIFFRNVSGALAVDIEAPDAAEQIYSWYTSLNSRQIEQDYRVLEETVYQDDLAFAQTVREFLEIPG